jgi:diacylglycerol kinase family enzyme
VDEPLADEARALNNIPAFVNAEAGNADEASAALSKAGCFTITRVTPAEIGDRVREAMARGANRVLVAGGDGSIAAAAAALCGTRCELAILPAGTLNHLAKDLGLPEDLEQAARIAQGRSTTLVDVGEVNGRIFLNTSSVGAYATYVRTRERLEPRLGYWVSSIIAALRILVRLRRVRVTVEVNGRHAEYDTPLVFIGVGERELKLPTLGKRVASGRAGLHVMVIRSRSGARVLALALAAAARGIHAVARTPALDAYLVETLRIELHHATRRGRIAVDGEIIDADTPLQYRLRREALRVVVAGVEELEARA